MNTWNAVFRIAILLASMSTLAPALAQSPPNSCGAKSDECTQSQALESAQTLMAEQDIYAPTIEKEIRHNPVQPGSEYASYCVYWINSTPPGCSALRYYRARTFGPMPENPCGAYSKRHNCTRASARAIAEAIDHYFKETQPAAGSYVADYGFEEQYRWGQFCVRKTNPSGCYGSVYYSEPLIPDYEFEKEAGTPCPEEACGNPINTSIGNKFQKEQDLRDGDLGFTRYYNSDRGTRVEPAFGPNWTHTFSRRAEWQVAEGIETTRITRPEGNAVKFTLAGGLWQADGDVAGTLEKLIDGSGIHIGWAYTEADAREIEFFDVKGRLESIVRSDGRTLDFEYNEGAIYDNLSDLKLTKVLANNGRTLSFEYDLLRRVSRLVDENGSVTEYTYDSSGRLSTVVHPGGAVRTYVYNEPANTASTHIPWALTGIVDELGNRFATFKYDSTGRAVQTKHAGDNASFSVTYSAGDVSTVSRPDGATETRTSTTILGNKKVIEQRVNCSGCTERTTLYSYDTNGYVASVTNPEGVVTEFDYDALGQLTQRIDASNDVSGAKRTLQRTWHADFRAPTEERLYDASNILVQRSTWTYNSRGQVLTASAVDPVTLMDRTVAYAYCESGDVAIPDSTCPVLGYLKSIDGPQTGSADTTSYAYHPADDLTGCATTSPCHRKGDLHVVIAPGGLTTTYARYDLAGRPTRVLDANGVATDLEYNARGWLTARKVRGADNGTETDDAITRLEYDNVGQVTQVIQPDGAFVAFTYDDAHRLTGIEDNLGNTVTYTLDGAGNRIAEETRDTGNVLKHSLSRVYDQLGQLETLADALSTPTDFTYDVVGQVDTVTDAFNRTTDHDYDPLGRLKRSIANVNGTGPERAETHFQYDALDNLTAVIDPKGLTTSYAYNGLGDLVTLTSPDTGTTTYTYDSAGNRSGQLDARGVQSTYSYDALNRLTAIDLPTAGQDLGFSYDTAPTACAPGETFATGRLSRFTDPTGSTAYCYDRRGNVVRKVQSVTGTPDATVGYTHNAADRLVAMTYPSGAVVTYLRDAAGRITGVTAQPTAGSAAVTVVSDVDYLPFGPATAMTFGNGRTLDKTYDANYGIAAIADSAVDGLALDYTLDAVGNVTGLDERLASGSTATRSIDYDALDRLTGLKDGATTVQGFTYDATGNHTSKIAGSPEAYTYPSTSHRLTQTGATARGYDAAGNTTAIGATRVFTYDDRGRMSQLTDGGVLTREYGYTARGERVVKRNPTVTGGDVTYVYDEAGRLLGEYDEAGTRIQEYVWLDDTLVAVLGSHGGSDYQVVLTDHLGTPRAVVHPGTNAILWRWDLTGSAFGDHAAQEDPDGDSVAYTFNLRYPGQYYDGETGLHYNYFRDYDPGTGRYVQSDPIGLAGGPATFSYALSSPLLVADPLGLFGCGPGERMVPALGQESSFPTIASCAKDPGASAQKICASPDCLLYKANETPDPIQDCIEKCLLRKGAQAIAIAGASQTGQYAIVAGVSWAFGPEVGVPVTLLYSAWRQGRNAKLARAALVGNALQAAISDCRKECITSGCEK